MNRVLISRLSSLGDVVCTLPAAVALKHAFPEVHITWAVDPRFAGVVECCGAVDEVVRCTPGFSRASWPVFAEPFDAALDLQGLLKSGLVLAQAKAPQKLGYHWQREGSWLFSARVLPDPTSLHVVDQYVDVARALGGTPVGGEAYQAEFRLTPKPEALEAAKRLIPQTPFVVVNAGAGWATKRWAPASFARVIDRLQQEGFPSVLIGGKAAGDIAAAYEVLRLCATPPANLLGKTSITELIALVSLSAAHLGGDTGSTHIAAALGVPAVGLYSITRPERCCPYGQRHRTHYNAEALNLIEPEPVLESLLEALHSRP